MTNEENPNVTEKQTETTPEGERSGWSRRQLLFGGGTTAIVGAAAFAGGSALASSREESAREQAREEALGDAEYLRGEETIPFYGEHQAGIEMYPQAHQTLVALNLNEGTERDDVRRLLSILTDDAARLTQGKHALADSEPEMAEMPARLTITFGFGERLVNIVNPGVRPDWLQDLPAFDRDELEEQWSGGDLLLQIASDNPLTLAHAQRMLLKDSRAFGAPAWVQPGFRTAYGTKKSGTTERNLFGHLDGTSNMTPGSDDFASVVWQGPTPNPEWMAGGTGFVVRRIAMDLDGWDLIDKASREESIGRKFSNGAPLTGTEEFDEPNFEATNEYGFPVIAPYAHIRRTRTDNPHERMFRRFYNYDEAPTGESVSKAGMIFGAFQYNVTTQYVPIQKQLDELDLLNTWISHIGSAVFAIPPGIQEGQFIGQSLFEA